MRIIPGVLKAGVSVFLSLCIALLVLYSQGSFLSDASLVILLRLMRYSGALLAIMSVFAVGHNVWRIISRRLIRCVFFIIFYFFSGLFGLVLAVLGNVIIAITG